MSEAAAAFDELVGALDYSMLIVTAAHGQERAGCLVGFATQCSIDPPRFLVCLSEKNRTLRVAQRSEALMVHAPTADMHELVALFGSETGDEIDKFERVRWHRGALDLPVLDECPRWFGGPIVTRVALGDHIGFVIEPVAVCNRTRAEGFGFRRAKSLSPGHEA